MLSSFFSLRTAKIYGQCLLSTRSFLQPTLRNLTPCSTIATIHTTRTINDNISSTYDLVRRGTRSATQTFSRRKWTPEEDTLLETLYTANGPLYTYLSTHFTNRSPSAISSRIKILFNSPKETVKTGPWEQDELDALRQLTKDTPEKMIDWASIKKKLPQPRNLSLIKQTWYHSINPKWNHGRWNEQETRQLEKLVATYGDANWCTVSDFLGTRSPRQCLEKYRYQLKASQKGRFTHFEDAAILAAVEKHGAGDFMLIKDVTNSQRTPRQISQRYRYHLDPAYDRSPWTDEERMELYKLAQTMGSKDMIKIRERMNTRRHGKDMRNQYMLMKRSLQRSESSSGLHKASQLELNSANEHRENI